MLNWSIGTGILQIAGIRPNIHNHSILIVSSTILELSETTLVLFASKTNAIGKLLKELGIPEWTIWVLLGAWVVSSSTAG